MMGMEQRFHLPYNQKGQRRMKNARQLLEEFTASSFRDPRKAAEMFAEDGAFEMPYLESLGIPWRYAGRKEVEGFFKYVRGLYPNMEFQTSRWSVRRQTWWSENT